MYMKNKEKRKSGSSVPFTLEVGGGLGVDFYRYIHRSGFVKKKINLKLNYNFTVLKRGNLFILTEKK